MSALKKLDEKYVKVCNEYIKLFCKKQDIECTSFYWVHECVLASFFDEYFFNFDEIRHDLLTDQPKGQILEWQNHVLEHVDEKDFVRINYTSYCKGLRYEHIKK